MHNRTETFLSGSRRSHSFSAFGMALFCLVSMILTQSTQAQTFTILHNFTGGPDGDMPYSGVTLDRVGNLYGTTTQGGNTGLGTVYQLKLFHDHWLLNPLYQFQQPIGAYPQGRVVFGPDSSLYGISSAGGTGTGISGPGGNPCPHGCGAVYKLQPQPTSCKTSICNWIATSLYSFTGGADGYSPSFVDPVFDQAGNLYGTTEGGGPGTCGVVFQLTPGHGSWTESVLHGFDCGFDGFAPSSGITFDTAGNIYGTASAGGAGGGTVYKLSRSGSSWIETTLYAFQQDLDGSEPVAPVLLEAAGTLYGATIGAGPHNDGTVFKLQSSGGNWIFSLVFGFDQGRIYGGPNGNLLMDSRGNIYGTTWSGGAFANGSVFKLTPTGLGGWTYTSLHDFTGEDGSLVFGGPTMDANGNLYGTAAMGGQFGHGVVWKITP
jgi:uncharacterized repeat protein (TIGR03803 family)